MFEKLSLEAVIKEVREKGNSWAHIYRSNEEATKQQLILPILSALGWDIFSPKDVIPEIPTHRGGRVDYALYINNNCVAYLEAKSLGVNVISDENALEQLGLYCFKDGVRLGILTNGT